jgi:hypothetical protein
LFAAGPLLGYARKVTAADPESAGVEAAGAVKPDACCGTVTPGSQHCRLTMEFHVLDGIDAGSNVG